ncbi:MAG: TetR/AcrR family transcriptional regulator [Acidimicrobiia bacterium]
MQATTSGAGTKELIVVVARQRFADHGFSATSLTEIADEVGIRRPSLLHHFPSKEALYQEVLMADLADWGTLVQDAVADPTKGWPQVERVVRAAFKFFEDHPDFVRLIRREALDGGPMLSEQLRVVLRPMFDRGVMFLQEQMDAGLLRQYDPAQLLLTGYGAALSYLSDAPLIASLLDGDPLAAAALTARREHVLDLMRNALEP